MKKLLVLGLCLSAYTGNLVARSAVTYALNGGCFGDNLISYCHAKWIAYTYDIPLLYWPFPYSDQLMMHELEIPLTQEELQKYPQRVNISQQSSYVIEPDKDILYIIPYFPESIAELSRPCFFFHFTVGWTDDVFKEILKRMISPRLPIPSPDLPKDCLTVALHVRLGKGFEVGDLNVLSMLANEPGGLQLKHPYLSYYTRELKRLISFYRGQKIYVRLFTDASNTKELIDIFKKEIDDPNVIFDYRLNNRFDLNVLEDFFALIHYDCLIRPDSNFSIVASKISNYKLQISPWHSSHVNNEYVIDEICMNGIIYKLVNR